ncbi:MAG: hypothetical protein DMF96_30715 [Acidobacteria bacterium]|nr:MAG: hypothetical protein DMF96_30715 [Acidobacteriota bacterium]
MGSRPRWRGLAPTSRKPSRTARGKSAPACATGVCGTRSSWRRSRSPSSCSWGPASCCAASARSAVHDLTTRVEAVPGVRAVGAVSYLPLAGLGAATGFTIDGQPPLPPGQSNTTDVTVCDNGYFRAMNVPLLRGRLFTDREMREKADVVIVNDTLARRYFPNEDPLGRRVTINMTDPNVPTEIVGVVGDTIFAGMAAAARPTTYWPHPQLAYAAMTLTVRTASEPMGFAALVQSEIRSLDKDQPVSDVRTMDAWVARSLAQTRFSSLLLTLFASLALLLAAIGIYGVMSYAVSMRTSEIGIRLALGAEARDIVSMIVGNAVRLAGIGLAIGVALSLVLGRTLTSLLYQTASTDVATFTAVIGVLGAVAVLASYFPARRASRIPPVEALRYQ